jgi:hypothetical protein
MIDLVIIGMFLALLWIGWELVRIADLMEGFVRSYRESGREKSN